MTAEKLKPVAIRMQPETKAWLEAKAREGYRTLNQKIALRLEQSRQREQQGATA